MYQAFLEQGNYEFRQGKYREAINSYSKAIARNPQSVEAHYGYGLAAEKLGRQGLAQDCFSTVVKLKSKLYSDEVILLKPPTLETNSLLKADGNPPENSVMAGIGLCLFLLTMMLRTVVFISYVADRDNSHSKPHINTQMTESVNDLNK